PDKDPHALDSDILVVVINADSEDQLDKITRLKAIAPMALRYPEGIGCLGVVSLAILEAPALNLQVWLAH
ncbi:hypothetical protein ABTF68_22885, partial [Acinetobacter baumannii]